MIKPMSIIAPRGGLRYDIPADLIELTDMSDCRNVVFEDGLVKKMYGYATFGGNLPLDEDVRLIDEFVNYSNTRKLIAVTVDDIYVYNTSSGNWDSIKDGALTSADTDFVYSAHVKKTSETQPWWVFTNGVDPIKKYTGTGNVSSLISTYPSGVTALLAKGLIEFKGYLILWDVLENGNRIPQRIRWSNTAQPEDFLNGNALYTDLTGSDWMVGSAIFRGNYIAILKEKSVWLGYATGSTDIFQFDRKTLGIGCVAGKTIASVEEFIIYMGNEDIYAFDGVDNKPIGGSIRKRLYDSINPAKINQSFARVLKEKKQYWLYVPEGSSSYPNATWVLDYNTGKWTRGSLADYITATGSYIRSSGITIGELIGTIGQQTWRIGDRQSMASSPVEVFGDSDGNVYSASYTANDQNDTAIDGWFTTKDFNPANGTQRVFINRIDVFYIGQGITVSYSIDKGKTWTDIGTCADSNNFEVPRSLFCKIDCLYLRLRFRNNTSGEFFEFSMANVYYEKSGIRL